MSNSVDDSTQKEQEDNRTSPIPWSKTPKPWLKLPISSNAKLVLIALDQSQGQSDYIQIGLEKLSEVTTLNTRSIRRAILELIAVGVVTREATWRSNKYLVNNPCRERSNRTKSVIQEDKIGRTVGQISPTDTERTLSKNLSNKQWSNLAEVLANALTSGCPVGVAITPNRLLETKAQLIKDQGLNPHEVAQQALAHTKTNSSVKNFGAYLVATALDKVLRGDLDPSKLYVPQTQPDSIEKVKQDQHALWLSEVDRIAEEHRIEVILAEQAESAQVVFAEQAERLSKTDLKEWSTQ